MRYAEVLENIETALAENKPVRLSLNVGSVECSASEALAVFHEIEPGEFIEVAQL